MEPFLEPARCADRGLEWLLQLHQGKSLILLWIASTPTLQVENESLTTKTRSQQLTKRLLLHGNVSPFLYWNHRVRSLRRIAAAVREIREAMQAALTARRSRLSVTLPPGARLGMEKANKSNQALSRVDLMRGDRELARCIIGLFEGTGLKVCAVFAGKGDMEAARKMYGPLLECAYDCWTEDDLEMSSASSRKSKTRKSSVAPRKRTANASTKGSGFGVSAAVAASAASSSNESSAPCGSVMATGEHDVYIVVAPRQEFLASVRRLSQSHGDETLVILANARTEDMKGLPSEVMRYFNGCSGGKSEPDVGKANVEQGVFEDVYYWKPNPSDKFAGGVLFRKFPDDWVLCRATPLGQVQRIRESSKRPSAEKITDALREEAERPASGILDRVVGFMNRNQESK